MNNINAIILDYVDKHRQGAERDLRWFAIQPTLDKAVSLAALAQSPSGKRLDHQRRIPRAVLDESRIRLLKEIKRLEDAGTFEELFDVVDSVIGVIEGIGELTVYDTALRIGAKLGLEPENVYLHAGTRVGARNLGVSSSAKYIPVSSFPNALRKLKAREIEEVLCIYKDYLDGNKLFRNARIRRCYG